MKILFNNNWIDCKHNYTIPQHLNPVLIRVHKYYVLSKIKDQYIQFPTLAAKLWKVYNYIGIYGIIDTFNKVRSRVDEGVRNDKYVCCGFGTVNEKQVFFIAPNNQYGHNLLNLPSSLVFCCNFEYIKGRVEVFDLRSLNKDFFTSLAGFSYHSGTLIDNNQLQRDFKLFYEFINNLKEELFKVSEKELLDSSDINLVSAPTKDTYTDASIKAVLFGYGNYAKTIIIPYLFKKGLKLTKVHEIDPTQLLTVKKEIKLSTNPSPDVEDKHEVWVIASYHHTHVDIAFEGMKRGATVIIEKPLATTMEQFEAFSNFIKENKSTFFLCFQKRYSKYNNYIFQDLKIVKGNQLDYYTIVYEESLGDKHWYNWSNSQTRIISNGCHWIDHFMFLNDYCKVILYDAEYINSTDIFVKIVLENKSSFGMMITESGSKRLGVREYIRISSGNSTVEIRDNKYYASERDDKVIREKNFRSKLHNLKIMYKTINNNIINGSNGDSYKSLESSIVCIQLNDLLKTRSKPNETTYPVV